MKSEHGNAKIKVMLFLLGMIALAMLTIPFFLIPPGNLMFYLKDGVFDSDLSDKKAYLTLDFSDRELSESIQEDEGKYVAVFHRLRSGQTNAEIRVDGYEPYMTSLDIPSLETGESEISLVPMFGRLKVFAMNAVNNKGVPDFHVRSSTGHSAKGSVQGAILSELEPGSQEIEVDAPGFCPARKDALVEKGKTKELTVPMSPELSGSELARIILSWGKDPRDLDSHLFLPKHTSLKSRHIYYGNKKASFKNGARAAELDLDDTTSYGPETVTITKKLKGTYQYAIYLYAGKGTLGRSGATVEVVKNKCEKQKFSVPSGCTKKWWHVFDIKYDGSDVRLISQNACRTEKEMNWKVGKK